MEVKLFMARGSDGGRPIMPIEIYNAGEYLFPNRTDVYILGYNRLLSYGYQKKKELMRKGGKSGWIYIWQGQGKKIS